MNPLHATIEEFAAEGYTHVECDCPRCRMTRLRPISWLPRISMGLPSRNCQHGSAVPSAAVRLQSVKPWRLEEVLGKPFGRRRG